MKLNKKRKRVLYGGAFDLIHYGHVLAIKKAKTFGDYLIVEISPDKRVRKRKGKDRPIISGEERAGIVRELKDVDEVIHRPNAAKNWLPELLDLVKPDVLLLNDLEITPKRKKECSKRGIKLIPFTRVIPPSGLDTTKIITKIRNEKET